MSKKSNRIDLSSDQALEIMNVRRQFLSAMEIDVTNPEFVLGDTIASYIGYLSIGAEAENYEKRSGKSAHLRDTSKDRRNLIRTIGSFIGRNPTAKNIVDELAKKVETIPSFLEKTIRDDIEHIFE